MALQLKKKKNQSSLDWSYPYNERFKTGERGGGFDDEHVYLLLVLDTKKTKG